MQLKPNLPLMMVLLVDSLFFSSTDFTGVGTFRLKLQIDHYWISAIEFLYTQYAAIVNLLIV